VGGNPVIVRTRTRARMDYGSPGDKTKDLGRESPLPHLQGSSIQAGSPRCTRGSRALSVIFLRARSRIPLGRGVNFRTYPKAIFRARARLALGGGFISETPFLGPILATCTLRELPPRGAYGNQLSDGPCYAGLPGHWAKDSSTIRRPL